MPVHRLAFGLLLAALLAIARPASAQSDADMEKARGHFEAAMELSDKQDWKGALAEFEAAYATKPFPAFLYNAAVCHEKLKDYPKAVELFRKYLTDDPKARDKAAVEKRIAALEAEIKAIAEDAARQPPPDGTQPPPDGTQPPPDGTQPPVDSRRVDGIEALPDLEVKGLVVIESKPPGATIYLDDKKRGPLGMTPWNGSIDGEHLLILESKGFKAEKKKITPSSDKLVWMYIALSEEHYLGWLEVRANIPAADVYIDKVEVGAVGRTPFMGNVTPGKHTIIVTKNGYTRETREITVEPGKPHNIDVSLEKAPVGFVHVRGDNIDGATVYLGSKKMCQAPCKFESPSGDQTITVRKGGRKPYKRKLTVGKATEIELAVKLAKKPGNADAYWKFFFGAVFIGGGLYLGKTSNDIFAELEADIMNGMPPPASDDPRFLEGKAFAWGADAAYVLGGITIILGIWDLFEDKGPPSTGTAESRDITFMPTIGPDYAGFGGEVRW